MAVGTVTISEQSYGTVKKIVFAWTCAANGVAEDVTTLPYSGEVIRLATVPGTGNNAPTALYDVTITDEDSTDVLMGAGMNRSATATEQVLASSLGCVAYDKLTLNIANAGNATQGNVYIYIR